MRRQIVLTIDCEDVRCGECKQRIENVDEDAEESALLCQLFHDEEFGVRGPLCLAAERKLAALIEAGSGVVDIDFMHEAAWDRAVAAIRREEGR